jgi:hypothetical protein
MITKNGFSTKTNGPISYIGDDKITYRVYLISKTLLIQRPPYEENGDWKMVLENHEFLKISEEGWDICDLFKKWN